jgi:hypothetical protein
MESTQCPADHQQVLEVADRVARAAHIWIRHGYPGARTDLVAGLISGLCDALELHDAHALLAGYAYTLIEGETVDALVTARSMLHRQSDSRYGPDFRAGLQAARDLIVLLDPSEFTAQQTIRIMRDGRN